LIQLVVTEFVIDLQNVCFLSCYTNVTYRHGITEIILLKVALHYPYTKTK